MKQDFAANNGFWVKSAAVVTLFSVALLAPDVVLAQSSGGSSDLGLILDNFRTGELSSFPPLISAVCYIGGAFLTVSGALKLKAHAEKPDSEKMAPGIARLALGAALIGLPALMGVMTNTAGFTGNQPEYKKMEADFTKGF